MFKKEFIIGTLAVFFFFGLFGTAFAGEGNFKTLLGTDEYVFDAPETKAEMAANNHVYDQDSLANVDTEGGNWEFKFDAPETKADIAARNYNYDQEHLSLVGAEGGDSTFELQDNKKGVICSINC